MVLPNPLAELTQLAAGWPLAAGWIEAGWLDGLGPLLVVAFWIIRQVMVAIGEQRENEKAKREDGQDEAFDLDQEPALAGVPEAPAKPEPVQGELRSEVEEFLRRIGEMPADPSKARGPEAEGRGRERQFDQADEPGDPPSRRQPIDPFEEPPRRQQRSRQAVEARQTPPPAVELLIDPEQLKQEPVRRGRQELRHLPESQLAEQAAHLGEGIAGADDRLEARLHDKFDHRLGKIHRKEELPEEEEKPAMGSAADLAGASRIKDLLSRPGGVREAVVLSEILRRPSDQL